MNKKYIKMALSFYLAGIMILGQTSFVPFKNISVQAVGEPAKVAGLTGTVAGLEVTLSWNVTDAATSYNVYRSIFSNRAFTKINNSAVTTTNYTDSSSGLANGTYYYRITALNSSGESVKSDAYEAVIGTGIGPLNTNSPSATANLIFVNHSTGQAWLDDSSGELAKELKNNNYYVSDTRSSDVLSGSNYLWCTDIGYWYKWFRDINSSAVLDDLYSKFTQMGSYARLGSIGSSIHNDVIMLQSGFLNSTLKGSINNPVPNIASNSLKGKDWNDTSFTVENAKGIYIDLLDYFKTRQDKLFVIVTAPPLDDDPNNVGGNVRDFNNWLTDQWLLDYPYNNVVVFDYYNVITSNNGDTNTNDIGLPTGNHHRYNATTGKIEHIVNVAQNTSAYAVPNTDADIPTIAGRRKANAEYIPLLNIAYNYWKASINQLSNTSPVINTNASLSATLGGSDVTLTNTMLRASDSEQNSQSIIYTINTAPTKGYLKRNDMTLGIGSTFTQDDIDNSRIKYSPKASNLATSGNDGFTFRISDTVGGSVNVTTFNITVAPAAATPTPTSTPTPTATPTTTVTPTATPTPTGTITPSVTVAPTGTITPSVTVTPTPSSTTVTPTPKLTAVPSVTPKPTAKPSPRPTIIPIPAEIETEYGSAKNKNGLMTVELDTDKMEDIISKKTDKELHLDNQEESAKNTIINFNYSLLTKLQEKDMNITVTSGFGGYTIPSDCINNDEILQKTGAKSLANIKMSIKILKSNIRPKLNGAQLINQPLEFKITYSGNGKTGEIKNFKNYVGHEILVPDGKTFSTVAVVESNGTLRQVPTKIIKRDGNTYAVGQSMTNSVYVLVNRKVSYSDIKNHWGREIIENMASRLIVSGVGNTFNPDQEITRGEFISILVKGLGLKSKTGTQFTDVDRTNPYYDTISAAKEYGIAKGYNNRFRPKDTINKEEASMMISKAMEITQMDTNIDNLKAKETIVKYFDGAQIDEWALKSVALTTKSGILNGTDGILKPKKNITRVEATVLVRNLLKKSGLFN